MGAEAVDGACGCCIYISLGEAKHATGRGDVGGDGGLMLA